MKKPIPIHPSFLPFGLRSTIEHSFNKLPKEKRTKENYFGLCQYFYNRIINSWK